MHRWVGESRAGKSLYSGRVSKSTPCLTTSMYYTHPSSSQTPPELCALPHHQYVQQIDSLVAVQLSSSHSLPHLSQGSYHSRAPSLTCCRAAAGS